MKTAITHTLKSTKILLPCHVTIVKIKLKTVITYYILKYSPERERVITFYSIINVTITNNKNISHF